MLATLSSTEISDYDLPPGYTWRGATLADLAAVVAVTNAHSRQITGADELTANTLQVDWTTPQLKLADDARVVLTSCGQIIGCGTVWGLFGPFARINVWLRVHPDHQQRGLEAALLQWAEDRVRQVAVSRAASETRICLTGYRNSLDTPGQAAYKQAGFKIVRRMYRMQIELDAAPPVPVWPSGCTLRAFVPGQADEAVLQIYRESFQDHWGYVAVPYEEDLKMFRHWMTDPIFDPTLWLLVMVEERLVGISLNQAHLDEDPNMGWVSTLGVLREYRHQGVATAMLLHSFGQFYQRGQKRVGLGVDTQNLTGALRLYESVGMRVYRQTNVFEKELRPGVELSTQTLAA